jgi:hypothetical protein
MRQLPPRRWKIISPAIPRWNPALMAAFDNGRNRTRSVCTEAIDQNGGKE